MSSRKRYVLAAAVGTVLVVAVVGCYCLALLIRGDVPTQSRYQKALPPTATDVHEVNVDMFPDWTLFLKARMSRADYDAYITKMGFGPPSTVQTNSQWTMWADGKCWGATPPVWWNPSSSDPGTVGASSGRVTTLAKYENGYLYLVDFKY